MAGSLVGFIMLPVYTRYLTPADYGIIGLMIFTLSIIEGLFGARLAHALPRFYYEKESERAAYTAVSTAMLITIAVSIPVMLSMLTSSEVIAITLFDSYTYSNIVAIF